MEHGLNTEFRQRPSAQLWRAQATSLFRWTACPAAGEFTLLAQQECSRQAAANYRLAASAPQAEPVAIKFVLSFGADHESAAFVLEFSGWREAGRHFFAFAASNSNLLLCREH